MARSEFDHDQFKDAYPPGIERSWWHVARNHIIIDAFEKHIPKGSRVLEIGCGTGIVTEQLRKVGWDAKGVELGAPKVGLHAREHLFLNTDALELPQNVRDQIDVLALFDVIEHIRDAPAFLRTLLHAFQSAKYVIVTVPARMELWTSFDDHFGHFRRYDRPMMRNELIAAELRPESMSYFFHALYPAIALNNLFRGRERNIRFTAPAPGFTSKIHLALGALFAAEQRVLPRSLAGTSIIGVARRT